MIGDRELISPIFRIVKGIVIDTLILTEDLLTGIPEIDQDHQQLLVDLNAFDPQIIFCSSKKDQIKVLSNLYVHCAGHFIREEILMREVKYPYTSSHSSIHDEALKTLKTFIFLFYEEQDFKKESTLSSVRDMVQDWIVPHIREEDKIFANYYLSSKSKSKNSS